MEYLIFAGMIGLLAMVVSLIALPFRIGSMTGELRKQTKLLERISGIVDDESRA